MSVRVVLYAGRGAAAEELERRAPVLDCDLKLSAIKELSFYPNWQIWRRIPSYLRSRANGALVVPLAGAGAAAPTARMPPPSVGRSIAAGATLGPPAGFSHPPFWSYKSFPCTRRSAYVAGCSPLRGDYSPAGTGTPRKLTIVSEDDLRVIAENGYEDADGCVHSRE